MSKINTTYWGANVNPYNDGTYTYSYGISTNNIRALLQTNKYDPNSDSFDMSVSPWGIGYSAAGNRGQIVIQRQGSVDGSAPGIITKISFEGIDRDNTNRPFYMPNSGAGGARDNYNWIMSRVGGDCSIDSNNYIIDNYNNQILAGNSVSSGCISNQYACTYLNYQHYKLAISAFNYIDLDTGAINQYEFVDNSLSPSDAKTHFENYNFPEHMAVTTIYIAPKGYAMYPDSPTGWTAIPVPGLHGLMQMRGHKIGDAYLFNKIGLNADADTKYKLFAGWNLGAYGVRSSHISYYALPRDYYTSTPYVRNIPVKDADYRPAPNGINYSLVQVDGLGAGVNNDYDTTLVSNYCDKEQSFADIKYKQRPLLYTATNNVFTEIKEGFALQTGQSQFRATSIYEVTDSDTFTKAQILALIKHEVAFYGFQFYIAWGNSTGSTWSVGDDDLFLPVFDGHLITTGNYLSGTAAMSAPNASWGNVFGDDMPVYDTEYNPAPKPQGDDEKDGGKLNNNDYRGINLTGSNKFYALDETELNNFINFINGMYTSDTDDTQLKVDFKGSNPNDYIVSVSAYPFSLPFVGTSENIPIGPISSTVAANRVEKQSIGVYSFGTIAIPKYYGDFRDFAPYTQIELYIPLAGTVSLDAAYYVGHSVCVEGVFDINTGSLSTKIIRISSDTGDETIDRVIDTSISVQIPVTSRNMGDYQNNLHQMRMNLINSAVSGVTQSTGILTNGAAQAAQGVTSGNPLAGLSTSSMDIFGATFNAGQNIGNAYYALKHVQPTVAITSTASAANAFNMYNKAILFIKRAKMLSDFDAEKYGKTIGYACLKNTTIGNVSGFTVCSDIDLSGIPATADEINAIKSAFESGVYV